MKQSHNFDLWDSAYTSSKLVRCYESHPALPIKTAEGTYNVYGGNCGSPVIKDADIYVALQSGSYVAVPQPWHTNKKQIQQIMFPIRDMGVPSSAEEFKNMINWLCNQLQAGKKIHVGCIGGHGRTGMVLSAMVRVLMPECVEAIQYVRTNYCTKAVETIQQVKFLETHFGAAHASGTKEEMYSHSRVTSSPRVKKESPTKPPAASAPSSTKMTGARRTFDPVPSPRSIFL